MMFLAALLVAAPALQAQTGPLTARQVGAIFGDLADDPPPARLSPGQRAAWIDHSSWLQAYAQRLHFHAVQRDRTLASVGRRARATGRLATLDREMRTIRQMIENDGRRYRTLPGVARARHDAAMSAVRNMRG
ncbi:MAG: hypothetical protein ABR559_07350 [Gemmatimonadota bacterium]